MHTYCRVGLLPFVLSPLVFPLLRVNTISALRVFLLPPRASLLFHPAILQNFRIILVLLLVILLRLLMNLPSHHLLHHRAQPVRPLRLHRLKPCHLQVGRGQEAPDDLRLTMNIHDLPPEVDAHAPHASSTGLPLLYNGRPPLLYNRLLFVLLGDKKHAHDHIVVAYHPLALPLGGPENIAGLTQEVKAGRHDEGVLGMSGACPKMRESTGSHCLPSSSHQSLGLGDHTGTHDCLAVIIDDRAPVLLAPRAVVDGDRALRLLKSQRVMPLLFPLILGHMLPCTRLQQWMVTRHTHMPSL